MKGFLFGVVFCGTLVGVVVFLCRFSAPTPVPVAVSIPNAESIGTFLAMQANQYALLQVHLVVLSIIIVMITVVLTIAGILGFKEIMNLIKNAISKKIEVDGPKLTREAILTFGSEELVGQMLEQIREKNEQKNSKEVFREGVKEMNEGLE